MVCNMNVTKDLKIIVYSLSIPDGRAIFVNTLKNIFGVLMNLIDLKDSNLCPNTQGD